MPFQSKAQMKYMFAKHPKIAKRWADKYGVPKNMPMHKGREVYITKGENAKNKSRSGKKRTRKRRK